VLATAAGAALYFGLVRWRAPDLLAEIKRMAVPRRRDPVTNAAS
jgi:hypothetical protein